MGKMPMLFSLLFFIMFGIYIFFGAYTIINKFKERLNKCFFILCIFLGVWSLGFSIAIFASDLEACLFWRRISAIGWCSIPSIILHFFLLLTRKKRILSKWWIYPLIYLPAFITIYAFSISKDVALISYNFVNTPLGWVNVAQNSVWDWFYNIYYASFMIASQVMIWLWGRRSSVENEKKQAKVIFFSFVIAFLIGTMTDIAFNSFLSMNVPQMAPVVIFIPIAAIFFSIKKYGFMNFKPIYEEDAILNVFTRAKIYHYISIILIIGGFLNVVLLYFVPKMDFKSVIYFSEFLILVGILNEVIRNLNLSQEFQDNLTISIVSLMVPIISLNFIKFASVTVWAFPFVFIIIFIVFNKRKMLVVLAISIFITQITMWVLAPSMTVKVDASTHIIRIILFCMGILVAFYVNKIYILRLKENADKTRVQKQIAEISSDFVNVNIFNIDEKINNMLEKIGKFSQVDRTYTVLFDLENETMTCSHEWCDEGVNTAMGNIQNVPIKLFPWWMEQMANNGYIYISDTEKLSEEACKEIKQFSKQGICRLISMPIAGNGKLQGFLGFDLINITRKWKNHNIDLFKIITNVLADALTKVNAEKKQNFMTYYDQLTKLPNRVLFRDIAKQEIDIVKKTGKVIGVLLLDLDSFKTVNDTMGHGRGDELLKIVGGELVKCVSESNVVARFGGDEFIILVNNVSKEEEVVKIANNIINLFNKPFSIAGQEFFITASIGIAMYPVDGGDIEDLIKNADVAMYDAKGRGKKQYVICSSKMKYEAQKTMELSNSLYYAQERNELILYYQPQINIHLKEIVGFEALLRWNHSELGMISPNVFIPLAEKTGLINPIGEWVIKTACLQNKMWQDMGLPHKRIAVNLSVIQFRNLDLVKKVENILKETGLDPKYLELEITESIAIKEFNYIVDILNQFKSLGASISIDDFGTEYSSLSRLKMLPVDRIKMDMQFVRGIEKSDKDKAIAKIIINLAKSLGMKVIAEGVETDVQLDFLNKQICDEVQGYYYYKPMPAEEIEALLKKQKSNSQLGSKFLM